MDSQSDDAAIRNQLAVAFEYAYLHDDWVNPLAEALAGVTVNEALWKPVADSKCIWEIVLHMAVWNENIVERIRSGQPVRPAEGAWPTLPDSPTGPAWEVAQRRLTDSLAAVRETIESTPLEGLLNAPWGIADLLCRYIHNGYHIGQITKLREWYTALPNA